MFLLAGSTCIPTANYGGLSAPYSGLGPGIFLHWTDIDTSVVVSVSGYASAVGNTQYSKCALMWITRARLSSVHANLTH